MPPRKIGWFGKEGKGKEKIGVCNIKACMKRPS
jgi:hypothetical protein